MPVTTERADEVRAAAHDNARDQARAVALNRGMPAKDAATLAAAVPEPLVGFSDGMHVHFVGDDAKTVGMGVEDLLGVSGDEYGTSVDHRVWNTVLSQLTEAGYAVVLTDAD